MTFSAGRHAVGLVCQPVLVICGVMLCLNHVHAGNEAQPPASIAEQLTRRAVDAGLQGDLQGRTDLLARAMRVDPDFAPARWEAGQIAIDGNWLPIEKAQARAAADPRLEQYQAACDASPDTATGHLKLAQWCRRNRLADEARYHWLRVLAASPRNTDALDALDSTWHNGQLVRNDVARVLEESEREQRKANRAWRTRIAKWERALGSDPTGASVELQELRSAVDASAIPEFERLASGRESVTRAVADRRQQLSLAFIGALQDMPDFPATESLCRFAVLAPDEPLRIAAANAVVQRPPQEFVPLLLAGLASPIESRFELSTTPMGNVRYSHELFSRGPDADQVLDRTHNAYFRAEMPPALDPFDTDRRISQMMRAEQNLRVRARQTVYQLHKQAVGLQQQVETENVRRSTINDRIFHVLREVVDEDLGDDPVAWWDYWRDYNEYESPPYRPTKYYRKYTSFYSTTPACECFVAGTPVWTKTGLTPIETVAPGDLVLSQDLATGEYAFRPVLTTTTRAPSPMLEVSAGGQVVQATLGHPFWLPGVGWKMAKELKAGDRLLAIDNPVEIDAIAEASDQEAFNLVVEGHGNYFVGANGLLVHDNTPRRPESVRLGDR